LENLKRKEVWKDVEELQKSLTSYFSFCAYSSKSLASQSGGPSKGQTLPWIIFMFSRQHTGD